MLYGDALQEIVTALDNAGIAATTEMAQLQLPGALVVPGAISFDFLDLENYSAIVDVYLVTADQGSVESLNALQGLLTKARTVFNFLEAEPVRLPVKNSAPDAIPALLLTLEVTITKE